MKRLFLLIFFALISCKSEVRESDMDLLNGYWEIEKVELSDGQKKEYAINEFVDYFEITNGKGFRKKVQPQFDGTFIANDSQETVSVLDSNNIFYLKYETDFGKWVEEIVKLQDSVLVLKNESLKYHYKRFIPISID